MYLISFIDFAAVDWSLEVDKCIVEQNMIMREVSEYSTYVLKKVLALH